MSIVSSIVDAVKSHGFTFKLYEPRELNLGVPPDKKTELTDAMKKAIKLYREDIIVHEKLVAIPRPGGPLVVDENESDDPWHPTVPPKSFVFVADAKGYMNENRKGEPYMWCWAGGPTWYYVKEHPVPSFGKDGRTP